LSRATKQLVASRTENPAATLASRGRLRPAQRFRHAYTGRVARARERRFTNCEYGDLLTTTHLRY